MIDGQKRSFLKFQDVRAFLDSVLDEDIHTKRVNSLANATLGVMTGASLGVALIGKSLAQALLPKHAIKQVDRLLSNRKLEAVFATWVPEMVGSRTDLIVAMDWTDYDADGHLALKLVTRHGRATPLVWLSVLKDELKNARSDYEDACLRRLAEVLPAGVQVTILAGFTDTKLFEFLSELGFGYVIRLKGNTRVGAVDGTTRPAQEWGGRARKLRDEAQCPVGAAVCVHAKRMKEPWSPAAVTRPRRRSSNSTRKGGRSSPASATPRICASASARSASRTLSGAAAAQRFRRRPAHLARCCRREPRHDLKSNTVKTRSHSLFRQGCMLYDLTPNMPEHRLRPLMERFAEMVQQSRLFNDTFAVV